MGNERLDLVLFGATGYTGELALSYLGSVPEAQRGRVGLAGRDPEKVAAARARLTPDMPASIIAADATDPVSLAAMAARAKVVVNLAGPYAERGPAVVEACVAQGAHYLDLSGEPLFVRDMIAAHHAQARAARVRIVHCAGFESLPFDMVTLLAVDGLRKRHGLACAQMDVSVRMKVRDRAVLRDAAFSGGTVATILALLQDTRGQEMVDPAVLLPAGVDPGPVRARHPLSVGARRDPFGEGWATPVYPAPTLNPQVILRSAALCAEDGAGYGPAFTYRESASMDGAVEGPLQHAAAVAMASAIGGVMGVIEHGAPWQRRALGSLVRRFGAHSGEGPRHALLDSFDYTVIGRARAEEGQADDEGVEGAAVTVTWDGLGNPGYRSTAKMVIQAGLALAHDGARLPDRFGVLTPAAALGTGFVKRLPAAGITVELVG